MKKQSEFLPLDFAELKKKLFIQNSIKARLLPFPFFCEMNYRDENNMYNEGLPLKYVNFDVEIVESFPYINITQTYEKNFSYKIETEFLF